jgi:hypothetical protein
LKAVDRALQCDQILTDKIKLEHSHWKKQLVLNTWSGPMEEDSLRDDWTYEGVLVGMQPMSDRNGIG